MNTYWLFIRPETPAFCNSLKAIISARADGRTIQPASFRVEAKAVEEPRGWEQGWLHRQLAHPWIPIGEAKWSEVSFSCRINTEEAHF
jgi:hypothetical protein